MWSYVDDLNRFILTRSVSLYTIIYLSTLVTLDHSTLPTLTCLLIFLSYLYIVLIFHTFMLLTFKSSALVKILIFGFRRIYSCSTTTPCRSLANISTRFLSIKIRKVKSSFSPSSNGALTSPATILFLSLPAETVRDSFPSSSPSNLIPNFSGSGAIYSQTLAGQIPMFGWSVISGFANRVQHRMVAWLVSIMKPMVDNRHSPEGR